LHRFLFFHLNIVLFRHFLVLDNFIVSEDELRLLLETLLDFLRLLFLLLWILLRLLILI
jgi:hypothetical protein